MAWVSLEYKRFCGRFRSCLFLFWPSSSSCMTSWFPIRTLPPAELRSTEFSTLEQPALHSFNWKWVGVGTPYACDSSARKTLKHVAPWRIPDVCLIIQSSYQNATGTHTESTAQFASWSRGVNPRPDKKKNGGDVRVADWVGRVHGRKDRW